MNVTQIDHETLASTVNAMLKAGATQHHTPGIIITTSATAIIIDTAAATGILINLL